MAAATAVTPQDVMIPTAHGRIHARVWSGADASGAGASGAGASGVDTSGAGASGAAASDRATPIVLLHDSLGSVGLWRDFPANLAAATGRTVIAYDRLGFGESDPHPGKLNADFVFDEAHDAFAALARHFELSRFIAFGHSVGGGMAVAIAAAYPQACAGVITESAQQFVEDRTLAGIREAGEQFRDPAQLERLKRYHGDKAQWVLDAWVHTWQSAEFADWNLDDTLPRVQAPFLAIHGENDEYGSMRHPEKFVALAGGPSRMLALAGCGHVPHRENEAVVLEAVQSFLARHKL